MYVSKDTTLRVPIPTNGAQNGGVAVWVAMHSGAISGEAVVEDAAAGVSFVITPLAIHLIEKYGFFQGMGSKYRIDPKIAADMLKGKL